MQGCLVRRNRVVNQAAREIERIAGAELEFLADRTRIVLSRVLARAFQSKFDRAAVKLPPLRSGKLKHDDVVSIEMGMEALRPRRRQVDVGLEGGAEFELKRST